MIAIVELKKVIYSTLHDIGLSVSNGLPINEQLPYIQIGALDFSKGGTKTEVGGGYELTLHVWCDAYDDLTFYSMIQTINDVLIENDLILENGFVLQDAKITLSTTLKDALNNQPINHGVIQIEFLITK